jgi:FKBP-type peptidyl-prolyl cis-trans isomerase
MLRKFIFCALLSVFSLSICFAQDTGKEASYAIGVLLGINLKQAGLSLDCDAIADGIRKVIETDDPGISQEDAAAIVQSAFATAMVAQKADNLQKSVSFLKENGKKKNITTTKSGLQYEVIINGDGQKPTEDSVVIINYTGSLIDGTVFDSSEDETVPLDQVIPGLSEGIRLMNMGSHFKLFIPPNLAYGDTEGEIPPNSVIIFDVELLRIE